MVSKHSACTPPDNDQVIWRYIDLAKFILFLDTKELFFTRPDKFEDPFEGSLPEKLIEKKSRWVKSLKAEGKIDSEKEVSKILSKMYLDNKKNIGVCSWHMNSYESEAMWKLYLKSDEGIAIQSTYINLYNCLNESEYDIHISKVKYIDYEEDTFPSENALIPFVHKRKSFEHEKELRAIISFDGTNNSPNLRNIDTSNGIGIRVKNINDLIENIYISPYAPSWFSNVIKSISVRYDINIAPTVSKISKNAMF